MRLESCDPWTAGCSLVAEGGSYLQPRVEESATFVCWRWTVDCSMQQLEQPALPCVLRLVLTTLAHMPAGSDARRGTVKVQYR